MASIATVQDVLDCAEELWPASLAQEWDAVGLVVGHRSAQVRTLLMAVDPVLQVAEEAVESQADMLITHHPLLLRGVTTVAADTAKGALIHRLIEGQCALLSAHTNADSAIGGVNDVLCEMLGLESVRALEPAGGDVSQEGLGRVGELPRPKRLGDFAAELFSILPAVASGVRVSGDPDAMVRSIGLCGGAGDSLIPEAFRADVDVFITGDLRHHPVSEARERSRMGRPYIIDVSHFASEWLWLPAAAQALGRALADRGFDVEISVSGINTDPWDFVITPGSGAATTSAAHGQ